MNPSKGMKGFMASTTSPSSKITAASPKKKVLFEKNQDSLKSHSVSVQEVTVEEISSKAEMGSDSEEISGQNRSRNQDFGSSMSQYQSAYTHFRSRFGSEEISGQNRPRKQDFSTSKSYHQSTPTHSASCCFHDAPLDADPTLPPYDPVINYLSPRPRFLHYKPRIELNSQFMEDLLYDRDGKRLEDSFSDSEGSLDCSAYTVKEQSSPWNKEVDHESSPIVMKTKDARTDETRVSELRPEFRRSKLIPFLLFVSIVSSCVLLTNSPIFYPFMKKDQYFAGPHHLSFGFLQDIRLTDYVALASRNLRGLATRMRQWPTDTVASVTYSSSFLRQEPDTFSSLNMTVSSSMVENIGLDFCYRSELELAGKKKIDGQIHPLDKIINEFEHVRTDGEVFESNYTGDAEERIIFEHSEDANKECTGEEIVWRKYKECLNSFTDPSVEFGTIINYDETDVIDFSVSEDVSGEDYPWGLKQEQRLEKQVLIELGQHDINSYVDAAFKSQMINKGNVNGDGQRDVMAWKGKDDDFPKSGISNPIIELRTTNEMDQSEGIQIATSEQVSKEGHKMGGLRTGRKLDEQVIDLVEEVNHPINKELTDYSVDPMVESQMMNENDVSAVVVNFLTGIQPSIFAGTNKLILAALEILSAVALATTLAVVFVKKKQTPASKDKHLIKRIGSVSGGTKSYRNANGCSYAQDTGVMEVVGDSDITEMRSNFYNSKQSKIGSQEMTPIMPRESGLSSSISYGSFTTFEKVSSRKGNRDEEVITPVRRSSRVRKQITSP